MNPKDVEHIRHLVRSSDTFAEFIDKFELSIEEKQDKEVEF